MFKKVIFFVIFQALYSKNHFKSGIIYVFPPAFGGGKEGISTILTHKEILSCGLN
ncbi:MAG: hypothetical protein LBR79_05855 [Oscillospiraceae bacterium]|nr:hypothetical protein [Oscillospiraceae bacterium]